MLLRTIILYAILHVVLFLVEYRRYKKSPWNLLGFIGNEALTLTQFTLIVDFLLLALGVIYLIAAFILWDMHLEPLAAA